MDNPVTNQNETTAPEPNKIKTLLGVILGASAGTLIEWYDFFIFGSLATILAGQFFPKDNPTAGLLLTLATFATGFVVRPFGALFFGRLGDLAGRKFTFLVTVLMMGLSTMLIGLVPTYDQIGVLAPAIVVLLRLLQGLALGGEYGGAATYVSENAPSGQRGFYTSFVQITATLGLFLSLIVIQVVRRNLGEVYFNQWGWRIPFLLSAVLVGLSYFFRMRMKESPLFAKLKNEGRTSKNPIKDSFGSRENRRLVLIALFGATAGQGVIFYTGQFYSLYFLLTVMHIEPGAANQIVTYALFLGTPLIVIFGILSDRIGRKKLMMTGCLLAALAYIPIYKAMLGTIPSGPELGKPEVSLELEQLGKKATKQEFANMGATRVEEWDIPEVIRITKRTKMSSLREQKVDDKKPPETVVNPGFRIYWSLVVLIALQVMLVAMVYGPIAAFLVELFPTRIRYTSMSVPYHIGNGVFGGLAPVIATAAVNATKNPLAGLWYPIAVAGLTFVIGSVFIREKRTASGYEELTDD